MVLALLAGRKTQTRRPAKFEFTDGANPEFSGYSPGCYHSSMPTSGYVLRSRGAGGCWNDRTKPLKPYALVGDRLWGRETHALLDIDGRQVVAYRATFERDEFDYVGPDGCIQRIEVKKWRPSIFMFREMSRLLHDVTAVRVERLLDITEADAIAEGLVTDVDEQGTLYAFQRGGEYFTTAREAYLAGWDTINGKGSAAKNPWVWVVSFTPAASSASR
jgi:hypothetical protein